MQDLFDIIDDITIKPFIAGTRGQRSFYPSSASAKYTKGEDTYTVGACLRQEFYNHTGYLTNVVSSPELEDKKAIGDWFEARFSDKFKLAGLFVAEQVPFYYDKYNISGRIDLIIKDPYKAPKPPQRPGPDHLIGVEIKSMGGYQNIKGPIVSTKDTKLSPKIEHVLQVMLYLDYYKQFGLNKWVIIYQDRDSMRKTWHYITLNEKGSPCIKNAEGYDVLEYLTVDSITKRFKELSEYIKTNTLPPRDYELQYSNAKIAKLWTSNYYGKTDSATIERRLKKANGDPAKVQSNLLEGGDWQCKYCAFSELCWSENPTAKMTIKIKPVEEPPIQEVPQDSTEDFA